MIVTIMKIFRQKIESKVINYWDYRNVSNEGFRESFHKNLK